MTSPADLMERLEAADPVSYVRHEADVDEPAPGYVLERILAASPRREERRPRRRRRVAMAAAAMVAMAIAATLAALPTGDKTSLAARAYAWSPPTGEDAVLYTETTSETMLRPPGGEPTTQRIHVRIWQRGDRMHELEDSVELDAHGRPLPDSARGRQRESLEHDQNGDVRRTLSDGKVQTIRADDPGWKGEGRAVFADNLRPVLDKFRRAYEKAQLRDAGTTTFAGRRAHVYETVGHDGPRQTFYIDPDTAQPFAAVLTTPDLTNVVTIDRVQRLPVTPENLAKLDAPAIDAAASGR